MPSPALPPRLLRRRPLPVWEVREPPTSRALRADPLLHWLALSRVEQIGCTRALRLVERFGSPEAVFAATPRDLAETRMGLPAAIASALQRGPDLDWARQQVRRAEDLGAAIVALPDPAYPEGLRHIASPPPVLFVQGALPLAHPRTVAVVGTREPSWVGQETARALVGEWTRDEWRIASGLARGVDETAHRTALDAGGETVAVLGCGLDQLDRSTRRELAQDIALRGLLVTEFPFGAPVTKGNFPRRNRLIAGLSQAACVVEAGSRSGALITARDALEQGREVLACPGPAGWPSYAGNFSLLRQGAALCAEPADLARALGLEPAVRTRRDSAHPMVRLLALQPRSVEELSLLLHRDLSDLLAELVLLELQGEVTRREGGRWGVCS